MASARLRGKGGLLETFKFAVYLALPITMVYVISDPANMKRLITWTRYVEYPAEGPRPPTGTLADIRAHKAAKAANSSKEASSTTQAPPADERPWYRRGWF